MAKPMLSFECVKIREDLPSVLVIGRLYVIEEEGVMLIDLGRGPVEYGGRPGEGAISIVQTLRGNESDKVPSVSAINKVLKTKADLLDGKIIESQLPDEIVLLREEYRDICETLRIEQANLENVAEASIDNTFRALKNRNDIDSNTSRIEALEENS